MRKTPGRMKQATPLNAARVSPPNGNFRETSGTAAPPGPAPRPPGPLRDPGPVPEAPSAAGGAPASGSLPRASFTRDGAATASTVAATGVSLSLGSTEGGGTNFGSAVSALRLGRRRDSGTGTIGESLIRSAGAPPPGRVVFGAGRGGKVATSTVTRVPLIAGRTGAGSPRHDLSETSPTAAAWRASDERR